MDFVYLKIRYKGVLTILKLDQLNSSVLEEIIIITFDSLQQKKKERKKWPTAHYINI